jgi:hypothetical protein
MRTFFTAACLSAYVYAQTILISNEEITGYVDAVMPAMTWDELVV